MVERFKDIGSMVIDLGIGGGDESVEAAGGLQRKHQPLRWPSGER